MVIRRVRENHGSSRQTIAEDPWLSDALEKTRLSSGLIPDNLLELSDYLAEQEEMESVRASLVMRTFLQSPYESPDESESEEEEA